MAAILEILPESGEPREIRIGNTATIGRTVANDVWLQDSPLVSRQHAILRCHNGHEYQLMDLGSRNGTFVEGNRVILPVNLHENARIQIGDNEIVFRTVPTSGLPAPDEVTLVAIPKERAGLDREVAILVCDIRGFSGFSEKLSPAVLVRVLGNWFRETGHLVQQSGGVIDKFIGDAVLAYWTEPLGGSDACNRALEVADLLLETAAGMTWPESEDRFHIGIALHHGVVSQGMVGIVAQRDATIIGDAVNIAFRLEGIMKTLGTPVVLSAAFHQRISATHRFEDHGEMLLKGKALPVRVYGMKI